ncbi:uncharacterized protein LOC121387599 [Gigantopelta aegis]|uniref:uncharacterized protein LOC121387599 n=1 Tax=Gigantopelta aegis TaxID=1735272 RepID=UPI001B88D140|nr:uncharacterized protein LOC121387599 [Gigantopelta aegis]
MLMVTSNVRLNALCGTRIFLLAVTVYLCFTQAFGVGTTIVCPKGVAVFGQQVNLTCHLHGPVDAGIKFVRPKGPHPNVVQCAHNLPNHYNACIHNHYVSGYGAVIEAARRVTLIIDSFNPEVDEGNWKCLDGEMGKSHTTCNPGKQDSNTERQLTYSVPLLIFIVIIILTNC